MEGVEIVLLEVILGVTTLTVSTFLGFLIFLRNRASWTNRLFLLLSLLINVYVVVNYVSLHPPRSTADSQLFWIRMVMFVTSFIGPALVLLVHTFPYSKIRLKRKHAIPLIILMLLSATLSIGPFVFTGIEYPNGEPVPIPGPGIPVFMLDFAGLFVLSFFMLIRKYKRVIGVERNQIRNLLVGVVSSFSMMAVFTVIFVVILKTSATVFLGPIFPVILMGAIAYAIIRYRFMDIRLILARSVFYILLVSLVAGLGTVGTIYLGDYLAEQYNISRFITVVLSSILIVLFIDPTKRLFTRLTERVFYKGKIDYQALLRDMSKILNEEIELPKLVAHYTQSFQQKMKLNRADLWLPVDEDIFMRAETGETKSSEKLDSLTRQAVVKELNDTMQPIILEEYDYRLTDASTEEERQHIQDVVEGVKGMRATFLLPVISKDHITGILALGDKRSGDSFSKDDIDFLNVIAPQLGAALEKARLYEDVKEFNVKLEHEVKNATSELRDANEKLKELDKAKSEFMSIASHQLRTPLAGISGYLSMIMDGDYGETAPEQKPILNDILNASQRLSRIVNVFLNVTRIEAGRFVMNFTKAPFDTVIEDIYKELKPTADKKDVKLTLEKTKLPEVEADIDKIKDVILNLVDNAIKYTPEGSVTIKSEANKRTVHVMVEDTGVGIAPEEAKNLFSKFVRGSGIAQVQPDGSGLGLYIAKRVVEGHSGKIWVKSEGEGKGSTFHFEVPIEADKDAKAKTKEFQDRAKGQ